MKFVIKLFPEIIVKSKPVRKRFISQLKKNLNKVLSTIHSDIEITGAWDFLEVTFNQGELAEQEYLQISDQILSRLKTTSGIEFILKVKPHSFETLDDIADIVVAEYADIVKDKTFCVRVKRNGKHAFNSTQIEQKSGGALLHNSQAKGVQLKDPEVTVKLEVKQDVLYTIESRSQGIGGYPMGQQESCVSLISGGYDSSVASYLMMKRGIRTHYCFFNLGGMAHEVGVKQVAHFLWEKYSASHRILFITIPFEQVVNEILEKVHHSQMGVVLKRMMLKVAEKVALEFNAPAIVTGECVGQVSSQTLTNLAVIDKATDMLTLRPLINMDKQDIINLSRASGSEEFAKVMPEYCGVISDKPTTRAKLERIEREEECFDFSILDQAFENRKVENIDEIYNSQLNLEAIEVVKLPEADDIVIDIRHPQELALKPLALTKNTVLPIPFFKLDSDNGLAKDKSYLLYCDKGVMSQLQAETLTAKGYKVKIYQP